MQKLKIKLYIFEDVINIIIMGLTMNKLVIIDFNLSKSEEKDCIFTSVTSIDLTKDKSLDRANMVLPYEKLLEQSKWSANDTILRIISVPTMEDPKGYIHNNDKYNVVIDYDNNDNEYVSIYKVTTINKKTNELKYYERDIIINLDDDNDEEEDIYFSNNYETSNPTNYHLAEELSKYFDDYHKTVYEEESEESEE
ncbi:hypothetical protein Catovirus_1_985 [Catovirus CTV1]|uniref:Uncharacterized protein n=1 Tax=Catovirus CTV1 TaxID=1977631 RepID=A0A1V0SB42_9VIRU|nr:hypothetical protein Catovirus_1_985 [Catovirus CTV1]